MTPVRFGTGDKIQNAPSFWPASRTAKEDFSRIVGLIGLEPMTLRLSSACSNQLSYRPGKLPKAIGKIFAKQKSGGKGTRTPDIQLAKLALYQLSYAPV